MFVCPECGSVLQTMDLPCPECAVGADIEEDASASLHEYSRTFRTRTAVRYRPAALAKDVSAWLATQDGLLGVSLIFHRDVQGLTCGATATCQASLHLTGAKFQVVHVPLAAGLLGKRRISPGDALNAWADGLPSAWRLNHWVFARAGVPTELWILYADGASSNQSIEVPHSL